MPPSPTRRDFVRLLGGVAGATLLPLNFSSTGCGGGRIVDSPYRPTPEHPLTPSELFYINYNFPFPSLPPVARWRLGLRGMVARRLDLSLDEIRAFPMITREVTLECIGNRPGGGLISSALFTAARMRDVLLAAGVDPSARGVAVLGLDGYPVYLPIEAALGDDALLVTEMNGAPITPEHGAPLRALFPGRFGMFSPKWLDSITLIREQPTWSALRGVATFVDGRSGTRSRIDEIAGGAEVRVGVPAVVTGLAASSGRGIARVEVEADGAWQPAALTFNTLDDGRSPYLWSLWRFTWTPARAGTWLLRVRATDDEGGTQPEQRGFPYDSSSIHTVRVLVRE